MTADRQSSVLSALTLAYEASQAGRTGQGERDFQIDYRDLLRRAGAGEGEALELAGIQLAQAEAAGLLTLERHRRDPALILKVRLPLAKAEAWYEHLDLPSPFRRREELARQFATAAAAAVPEAWRASWMTWCEGMSAAALAGRAIAPLARDDAAGNAELLELALRLLGWEGESLLRFASCVLCGNSKRLEALSPKLGQMLDQVTGGKLKSLESLGIIENPRSVLCHGPLRLKTQGGWVDLGQLAGPVRLSRDDLLLAEALATAAPRCVTIENETSFYELAKGRSGDLLVCTSYPGSATVSLLGRLPAPLEFWHFGDSDPDGFDILRDLRERTRLPFRGLHMRYRPEPRGPALTRDERRKLRRLLECSLMDPERSELEAMLAADHKGAFEQESLGRPRFPGWPFY